MYRLVIHIFFFPKQVQYENLLTSEK